MIYKILTFFGLAEKKYLVEYDKIYKVGSSTQVLTISDVITETELDNLLKQNYQDMIHSVENVDFLKLKSKYKK